MNLDDLKASLHRQRKKKEPLPYDPYLARPLDPTEAYVDKQTRIAYHDRPSTPAVAARPVAPVVGVGSEGGSLKFFQAPGTYTPVCVLHGAGGTGKTSLIRKYQAEHENENIMMTATTGVAAINIGPGCVTINSALKYYDEASLIENLERKGRQIAEDIRMASMIVIDEMSMLSNVTLELIYAFIDRINAAAKRPTRLVLSGDFCQLPPIARQGTGKRNEEIPFAFHAPVWNKVFEPALMKLTVNYRQSGDPLFQQALYSARHGDSAGCIAKLGCRYERFVNMDFPGLTLYSVNGDVDLHNNAKLKALDSPLISDGADTWGEVMARDWKDQLKPLYIKLGAQVRVTANDTPDFAYVNGDIATLLEYNPGSHAIVELHRGSKLRLIVSRVTRLNMRGLRPGEAPPTTCNGMDVPKDWAGAENKLTYEGYLAAMMQARHNFYDPKVRKWIIGAISYVPIAPGWASTIHKAQGLTVDALQLDVSNNFAGQPQMMYVALSRCRSAQNITVTRGDAKTLATRIRYHPDIKRFM